MRKTRFLVLLLVATIMLMGAGYAAWTDDLHVVGNVSTGTLDVNFSSITRISDECGVDAELVLQPNNDKALLTIEDMVPGSYVEMNICMQNIGDINAKWIGMDVVPLDTSSDYLLSALYFDVPMYIWDGGPNHVFIGSYSGLGWNAVLANINAAILSGDICLEPGEFLCFGSEWDMPMTILLPCDSPNTSQNQSAQFEWIVNYAQCTGDCCVTPAP